MISSESTGLTPASLRLRISRGARGASCVTTLNGEATLFMQLSNSFRVSASDRVKHSLSDRLIVPLIRHGVNSMSFKLSHVFFSNESFASWYERCVILMT